MDKKTFITYLQQYKDFESAIRRIEGAFGGDHNVELFETDWYRAVDKMLGIFLEYYFTEKGLDLIYNQMFDPLSNEYDLEEIWKELISDKELYFNA